MMFKEVLATTAMVFLLNADAFAQTVSPNDVVIEDDAVLKSLTGVAGDAAAGRMIFADRKLGNCLACHANEDLIEESFHGEVGPPMDGVADRWEPQELRAIVVNSKAVLGEETIMPAFFHVGGRFRIAEDFEGQTILTAQQVEDVIAYLTTLKEE